MRMQQKKTIIVSATPPILSPIPSRGTWLATATSRPLKELNFIDYTTFTRTPIQPRAFNNISYFAIQLNESNMTISAGSIVSNNPDVRVTISSANVVSVEDGAFVGKCNFALSHFSIFKN